MLIDGLKLTDTSVAENLIIQSGNALPTTSLNKGELFFLNGVGLHVYNGDEWEKAGGSDAPAATWSDLSGKPAVIASGATQADARTSIGLGNVDNTSDASKPISTATQIALGDLGSKIGDLSQLEGLTPETASITDALLDIVPALNLDVANVNYAITNLRPALDLARVELLPNAGVALIPGAVNAIQHAGSYYLPNVGAAVVGQRIGILRQSGDEWAGWNALVISAPDGLTVFESEIEASLTVDMPIDYFELMCTFVSPGAYARWQVII